MTGQFNKPADELTLFSSSQVPEPFYLHELGLLPVLKNVSMEPMYKPVPVMMRAPHS